jgi:hypothetical protein
MPIFFTCQPFLIHYSIRGATEKVVDPKVLSFHFTKHLEYTETPAGSKRSARPRRTLVRGDSPLARGKRSIFGDARVDPHVLLLYFTFSVTFKTTYRSTYHTFRFQTFS